MFFPKYFFIELTNYCNLKCSMCTFHSEQACGKRPKGFMNIDLIKKIINEIKSNDNCPWIALHGAGEPLLHKKLIEILNLFSNSNTNFGFLTNGMLLNEEMIKKILDTGIKWISISIDGLDKKLFEKYRKGSNYEQIVNNAILLSKLSDGYNISLSVNMTMQPEMLEQEPKFVDFWLQYFSQVNISPCKPLNSRKSLVVDTSKMSRMPCFMLYETFTIYWDGNVGLCCEDWFNSVNIGNIHNNSILDIFNSEIFTSIRNKHENNDYDSLTLCNDCDSWFNNSPESQYLPSKDMTIFKNAWQKSYVRGKHDSH